MKSASQAIKSAPPGGFDAFEATLGLRHRDIPHMIEIITSPIAPIPNKIKALRLLNEVLPGRQEEAVTLGIIDAVRPFLLQPPNGLLLNALAVFNSLVNTQDIATKILPDVSRLVEIIDPANEAPIRRESAALLRKIAEFVGPEPQFQAGSVPAQMVASVSSKDFDVEFLNEAFRLLSRLVNKQNIRVPLIESTDFLLNLIRSLSNMKVRNSALILAQNISMDPSNRGKLALLNAEILPAMIPFLSNTDEKIRFTALSLLALLAVPKDGKQMIATDADLPDAINKIAQTDQDDKCKKAAQEIRVLVAELPVGRAILGGFADNEAPQK